jgi:outer membrane usher protein FimD/PapC
MMSLSITVSKLKVDQGNSFASFFAKEATNNNFATITYDYRNHRFRSFAEVFGMICFNFHRKQKYYVNRQWVTLLASKSNFYE